MAQGHTDIGDQQHQGSPGCVHRRQIERGFPGMLSCLADGGHPPRLVPPREPQGIFHRAPALIAWAGCRPALAGKTDASASPLRRWSGTA